MFLQTSVIRKKLLLKRNEASRNIYHMIRKAIVLQCLHAFLLLYKNEEPEWCCGEEQKLWNQTSLVQIQFDHSLIDSLS